MLCISPSMKPCGGQTNKPKQVQIKQSTLAPFINLGLLQLDWPSLFDVLWCIQLSGAVRSHQTGRQRRYSAPELLQPPQRASGEMHWYAGKTSSISSPSESLRGFPCNSIRHIYSCIPSASPLPKHPWGSEPTLSSNTSSGSESNISIREEGGKRFAVLISTQRSTEGKYFLTNRLVLLLRF